MRSNLEVRDQVFAVRTSRVGDVCFDEGVAGVFDDMVNRSVPYYDEIQRMACELAADYAQPETQVYDLGCATGTTFAHLHPKLGPDIGFVGIDNAAATPRWLPDWSRSPCCACMPKAP